MSEVTRSMCEPVCMCICVCVLGPDGDVLVYFHCFHSCQCRVCVAVFSTHVEGKEGRATVCVPPVLQLSWSRLKNVECA